MNEMDSQPKVSPPAAYKAPPIPTLAALGAVSAAALAGGCANTTQGDPVMPVLEPAETQNASEEKAVKIPLRGEQPARELTLGEPWASNKRKWSNK